MCSVVKVVKYGLVQWAGNVAVMGQTKNSYRILLKQLVENTNFKHFEVHGSMILMWLLGRKVVQCLLQNLA
jgi:hypothetical protein